ncbi:unnamed protein product [Lupinus luteus]|uniref:Uncharacterized protein n=1 Tax=Lupinus luteus TaxID=3873 RepID=A0AAV1YK69_LUPLU
MVSLLRFRKMLYMEPVKCSSLGFQYFEPNNSAKKKESQNIISSRVKNEKRNEEKQWSCIDYWFWMIGYVCTIWWLFCFLCRFLPEFQHVPDSPGVRLSSEGVTALHPVVLVPGIVTGGLELWEGRPCAEGLFREPLWREHLSLHNETGLDPPGIRVRAVPGLVAADNIASGYLCWAVLIENLAKIGYEGKNLYMVAYDWRLSFQNTEIRDQALSRLKSTIELMFVTNGYKKVVVVPQAMGATYFLHFVKWVETPLPMGGGGGLGWCDKHIKAIMNINPAFLGVPKAVSNIFSAEDNDVAFVRSMAFGILNLGYLGLQTLKHVMRVCRTWDSIISLMPKGGETIWGNLDWSPKDRNNCDHEKKGPAKHFASDGSQYSSYTQKSLQVKESTNHGRIISLSNAVSQLPDSLVTPLDSEGILWKSNSDTFNLSREDVWTEYDEMISENIRKVGKEKVYTERTVFGLLNFVAPKMMKRAEAHFSHGIAENLDDPKYAHYKYWSNPLETRLPNAPDMEIYCLYGVGIPTERSHAYKLSHSEDGEKDHCLQNGVYFVDGDESAPVISAGFMCAKGWRGRTRFNPSGIATHIREYRQKQQGVEGGESYNIMGNVGLVEDVLRVAAGAKAENLGFTSYQPAYLNLEAKGNNLLNGANFASAAAGFYDLIPMLYHLYALGARRIGVTNIAPTGCLPILITLFGSHRNGCVDRLNNEVIYYNKKLNYTSEKLQKLFPDLNLVVFDIYEPLYNLVTNPSENGTKSNYPSVSILLFLMNLGLIIVYLFLICDMHSTTIKGFLEARRGCCGTGFIELSIMCNEKSTGTCANASEYVFWDSVHPTEAANKLLADQMVAVGIFQLIS